MRFEGPTQFSCGTGDTRRELVSRPPRSVSEWTWERRIAFLPGGLRCEFPAESDEGKRQRRGSKSCRGVVNRMVAGWNDAEMSIGERKEMRGRKEVLISAGFCLLPNKLGYRFIKPYPLSNVVKNAKCELFWHLRCCKL